MKITGIIWCLNAEDGNAQLRNMVSHYNAFGVKVQEEVWRKDYSRVVFDNNDIWSVRLAVERQRGVKCNISYIQRGISFDFIEDVIMPCMCIGPFSAYRFFTGESMNEI